MEAMPIIAALDLGSNSFHLIVSRLQHGHPVPLLRIKERVKLQNDLQDDDKLSRASLQRALEAIDRFERAIRAYPLTAMRAVGTAAMRQSLNSDEIVAYARKRLGCPVTIISGEEEAQLIYAGLVRSLKEPECSRLVFDIGGGSTEFVIGQGSHLQKIASLPLGCIPLQQKYFPRGHLSKEAFVGLQKECTELIGPIAASFNKIGWDEAWGCSGSVQALQGVMQALEWGNVITPDVVEKVIDFLLVKGNIEHDQIPGLQCDRSDIFPASVGILSALFRLLDIKEMHVSPTALREGLLYSLIDDNNLLS